MRSLPRRSRIAHFKAPFLASIASATLAAAACGGRTLTDSSNDLDDPQLASNGDGGTSASAGTGGAPTGGPYGSAGVGGSNPPGWPTYAPAVYTPCEEIPAAGSDCGPEANSCGFPGCDGPTSSHARCVYGQWLIEYSSGPLCNPPPVVPVCPQRIILGEPCTYEGQECAEEPCEGVSEHALTVCTLERGWKRVTWDCPVPSAVDAGTGAAADAAP